jgi:transposase-like protein
VVLKRSWAGEVSYVLVLVAIGVSASGYRGVLGIAEGAKTEKTKKYLQYLFIFGSSEFLMGLYKI